MPKRCFKKDPGACCQLRASLMTYKTIKGAAKAYKVSKGLLKVSQDVNAHCTHAICLEVTRCIRSRGRAREPSSRKQPRRRPMTRVSTSHQPGDRKSCLRLLLTSYNHKDAHRSRRCPHTANGRYCCGTREESPCRQSRSSERLQFNGLFGGSRRRTAAGASSSESSVEPSSLVLPVPQPFSSTNLFRITSQSTTRRAGFSLFVEQEHSSYPQRSLDPPLAIPHLLTR